jgi:hypothetical protein
MPSSKSAPHFALLLIGLAGPSWLLACSGVLDHPGATGGAGTSGASGTTGSGGTGPGTAGTTGTAGSGATGVGGQAGTVATGIAGNGSAGRGGTAGTGTAGPAGTTGGAGTTGSAGAAARGGTGGGGAGGTPLSRGPTPAMNGTNFPFPQNRQMSGCIYPAAYDNNDVMTAYTKWKADLVTSNGAGGFQRVQRTSSDGVNANTPLNSTVSEGIGYGMIIAVYMGDHTLFDNLWKYEQLHLDPNGLMNWSIDASGNTTSSGGMTLGGGAATDADEDMAWALVMADKQWGSAGALNYANLAKTLIQAIWNHEVYSSKLAGPGDSWGPTNLFNDVNVSYFAPAYYRLFKQVDTDSTHNWDAVTQTVYDTIFCDKSGTMFCNVLNTNNKNTTNGLVPGWATNTGGMSSAGPYYYQYDACRTPFRIGVDWCLNSVAASGAAAGLNPSRAQQYVALTSSFFSGVGVANIVDGYNMDGTVNSSAHPVSQGQSAAFIGPAAVGAMNSASNQSFVNSAYGLVKTDTLLVGGAYYEESWTVMSLLMLTGNFLDYTAIQPAH